MNWRLVVVSPKLFSFLQTQLNYLPLSIDYLVKLQKSNTEILVVHRVRDDGSRELLFAPNSFESLCTVIPILKELDTFEILPTEITDYFSRLGFHFLFGNKNLFPST